MAVIILNLSTVRRMTPGERRLGQRLETLLEDDYTVWYDIPLGRQRRYLDFIALHQGEWSSAYGSEFLKTLYHRLI